MSGTLSKLSVDNHTLRTGVLFGIVAAAIVTTLIIIQLGNGIWRDQALAEASSATETEAVEVTWEAVNRVQALMDVSWDVFLSVGTCFMALSLLKSHRFHSAFGWTGLGLAILLGGLNLYTFPDGPAYASLFGAGPLLALWFGALFLAILRLPVQPSEGRR